MQLLPKLIDRLTSLLVTILLWSAVMIGAGFIGRWSFEMIKLGWSIW